MGDDIITAERPSDSDYPISHRYTHGFPLPTRSYCMSACYRRGGNRVQLLQYNPRPNYVAGINEDDPAHNRCECECLKMDEAENNPHGLAFCDWKPDTEILPVNYHDSNTGKYPTTTFTND